MAEFFSLLLESGLLTAAFIIGAIAVFIAIVGSVKNIIELSPAKALLLAFFGVFLMTLSIGGYFISLQTDKETNERTVQEPTEITSSPTLEAVSVTSTVTSPVEPSLIHENTPITTVNTDEVLSNIVSGNGGIEKAAPWWKAIAVARENGTYDPTEFPGAEGCFGVAWNVMRLDRTVVVFQSAQALDFQAGGHYSLICLTNNVVLSAIDVGRIQANWLSKEYGGTWRVQVLD